MSLKSVATITVLCVLLQPSFDISHDDCTAGKWLDLANTIVRAGEATPAGIHWEGTKLVRDKPSITPSGCAMLGHGYASLSAKGCSFQAALPGRVTSRSSDLRQIPTLPEVAFEFGKWCMGYFRADQEALKARGLLESMEKWLEMCGSR